MDQESTNWPTLGVALGAMEVLQCSGGHPAVTESIKEEENVGRLGGIGGLENRWPREIGGLGEV